MEGELRRTVSLVQSTLESTADGILVVNQEGRIVSFNKRFVSLFRIPETVLDTRDDQAAIDYVLHQLKDPDGFQRKVRAMYAAPVSSEGRITSRYARNAASSGFSSASLGNASSSATIVAKLPSSAMVRSFGKRHFCAG